MYKPSLGGFCGHSALAMPDELHALVFSHRSGSPAVSWIITFDGILKVVRLSFSGIFLFKSREKKEAFSSYCSL